VLYYLYILIALAVVVYHILKEDGVLEKLGMAAAATFCGAIVVLMVSFVTSCLLNLGATWQLDHHEVHPIVSLKTSSDVQGSFLLGCGTVGTTEYYYFMYDLGGGKYQRGTIETYNVVIQEDDTAPSLTLDVASNTNRNSARWWPTEFTIVQRIEKDHVLHVPKGTIIQKFEVR
jgi:hypothetical protein